MKHYSLPLWSLLFVLLLLFYSCDKNETFPEEETPENLVQIKGTGSFIFDEFQPLADKPTTVYYHVPIAVDENSKVIIVFHGASRDAEESRDALVEYANRNNQIVLVPLFSQQNFSGGDGYNLGNVFKDGDNPSPSTLNPEGEWAFSIVEPLFDHIKILTANATNSYHVFGFSAGGQFAHRFVFFKPNARFDMVVASSSGWYTMLDDQINFPYGIKESPITANRLPLIFSKKLTVLIGQRDNNPNAGGLRSNSIVDQQGNNRLARADYFYKESRTKATNSNMSFNWQFVSLPNVGHDFDATSDYAFNTIFSN